MGVQFKIRDQQATDIPNAGNLWARLALTLAHNLALTAMEFHNEYFDDGLTDEIAERRQEFVSVWVPELLT